MRRKQSFEPAHHRQLARALLLSLVASLMLLVAQPATAKGKPSFPAASHLCEMQGGVFTSVDGFAYACTGLDPIAEPAGMHATTPLCERASRGRYLDVAGTYLCLL